MSYIPAIDLVGPETPKPKRRSPGLRPRSPSSVTSNGRERPHPAHKIYRNLLILEDSLRQQVLYQSRLRRKYVCFISTLILLAIWLFVQIQDQQGYVKLSFQFVFYAICTTVVLFRLSGEYHKKIIMPKRFLGATNKGLRQFNLRLIKVKTSSTDAIIDSMRLIINQTVQQLLELATRVNPQAPSQSKSPGIGNQIYAKLEYIDKITQPRIGFNDVKLILNPRTFQINIRQGWEVYRNEFWSRDGYKRRRTSLSGPPPKNPPTDGKKGARKRRVSSNKAETNPKNHTKNKLRSSVISLSSVGDSGGERPGSFSSERSFGFATPGSTYGSDSEVLAVISDDE
ncbi:hypothetical protein BABINDRAFT_163233 [Babjeviella inositovora NRRL Y-12698]|uniref:Uncharacterized protein n=1 Tax=Babjeviella inositovora NRRL Y-12698 TaxID=984486 RepID=A0A1E3QK67_9ASCO|nr:uncharacterized protein BABINDRAFT_163233 [Babjeviella inositovora NRRL Y-12698]ODQ77854.1 hypothetical protein BABINDRAFT_163233 [Babjeviella inositovora NRRL Y-12698]